MEDDETIDIQAKFQVIISPTITLCSLSLSLLLYYYYYYQTTTTTTLLRIDD